MAMTLRVQQVDGVTLLTQVYETGETITTQHGPEEILEITVTGLQEIRIEGNEG